MLQYSQSFYKEALWKIKLYQFGKPFDLYETIYFPTKLRMYEMPPSYNFLYHLLAFEFYQLYLKALLFYQDKVILILAI